jgi:hypothetical protein
VLPLKLHVTLEIGPHPTAIRYLTELNLTGIGVLEKGCAIDNRPDTLTVSPKFSWLAASTPLTPSEGCGMEGGESESLHKGHSVLKGPGSGQEDPKSRCCAAEPPAKETGH